MGKFKMPRFSILLFSRRKCVNV